MLGQLPGHLRADVRFDHAAAITAADELRRLARALDDHAAERAQWLARTEDFRGHGRRSVEELTRRHGHRVAALVGALLAEAARIEADAAAAQREQAHLERARAAWRSEQRLAG